MLVHLWIQMPRQFLQPDNKPRHNKAEANDRYARPNPRQKRPLISEIFSRPLGFIYRRVVSLLLHCIAIKAYATQLRHRFLMLFCFL